MPATRSPSAVPFDAFLDLLRAKGYGIGLHEYAALAALLELVERDAVMVAWSNRLSLPLLTWEGERELDALDRRFFAVTGLRYSVIDASVLLDIPAAIGVLHGPIGGPLRLGRYPMRGERKAEARLRSARRRPARRHS